MVIAWKGIMVMVKST